MTSFGWKTRKRQNVGEQKLKVFSPDNELQDEDVGKLLKRKVAEDCISKGKRLKDEGSTLASVGRYWEAIHRFDEALLLLGGDEKVLDMKAQAYTELKELFPAVQTAEQAVQCNKQWWVSRQTLGRALMNMGEVKAAIISFQQAIHLKPDCEELWKEDLQWACSCLKSKLSLSHDTATI